MPVLTAVAFAAFLMLGGEHATSASFWAPTMESETVEHGGGCRKSSPPGQCCHKNHKTGEVHCH